MEMKRPARRVGIVVLCILATAGAAGAGVPQVSDLLGKYTQALDATNSYMDSYEMVSEYSYNLPYVPRPVQDAKKFTRGEHRSDGQRAYHLSYFWGDINAGERNLPESNPRYNLRVEAEQKMYSHSCAINNPRVRGTAYSQPGRTQKATISREPYSAILGYLGTDERLDAVLRRASNVSVRETTEAVNGSPCYVVDAVTEYGKYTVWLDPEHGYQAAKATREAAGGHKDYISVIPEGASQKGYVEITRFEQVDGVWVPMEGSQDNAYTTEDPQYFNKERAQFKRTQITLNPDHDVLGSFEDPLEHPAQDPELKNGTRVMIGRVPMALVRRNGRPVPDVDDLVFDELDRMVDQVLSKDGQSPTDPNGDPAGQALSAEEVLARYGRAQQRIRSLIVEAENTARIVVAGAEQTEFSRGEFRSDGLRVCHHESWWDNQKTTEDRPGYRSFFYAGEDLIEYSRPAADEKGSVVMGRNRFRAKTLVSLEYPGAALLGMCPGDSQRVDYVLKRAKEVSLRDKRETIAGAACCVVEAQVECGFYKLWIDPEHDYHLARLEVERKAGDQVDETELCGKSMAFSLSNVRFEQVNGVWVPMEADMRLVLGDGATVRNWHHKRTHVQLEPDHAALRSFVVADIPDETEVTRVGDNVNQYVWRKGDAVEVEAKTHEIR